MIPWGIEMRGREEEQSQGGQEGQEDEAAKASKECQ